MPVLDATVLIDLKRRPDATRRVLDRLAKGEEALVVPIQAAIEYSSGERDPVSAFRALQGAYDVVGIDVDVGLEASRIANQARLAGHSPPWMDVQIAATARVLGMYVVSRNPRHLRDALGCRVWDYAAEPEPPA